MVARRRRVTAIRRSTAVGRSIALVALALLLAACGGQPRELGKVMRLDPEVGQESEWTLVEVEGISPASAPIQPLAVDVAPDGMTATVYFKGGRPACYAVGGVDLQRHDPGTPTATVTYGMRLGVFGCTADLWNLALRVPLDPPFDPGG
jgi:hypothetical protein